MARRVALCVTLWALASNVAGAADLRSPDGRVAVTLSVRDHGREQGCLFYGVAYRGAPVLADSRLGLTLDGAPALAAGFTVVAAERRSHDDTWTPVYGERRNIRDHYNELAVDLADGRTPRRRLLRLTFRAYNEGVAFSYTVPAQAAMTRVVVSEERSEFRFTGDHTTWAVYSAQGNYAKIPLSRLEEGAERPLTVQLAEASYAAIAEARLVDYARMKISPLAGVPNGLVSDLSGTVDASLPLTTPWRVIMLAESPGRLLENSDLILNLNDPCAIADTSWIRPGKVIREVTLTTAGGIACVDFAVKHGLQYVEFDAGWYGHENDDAADARAVNVDPKRSAGPLDLHHVIRYAGARGIGIILYVNRRALERQIDELLPLYEQWGVKGVKYGFVNVGTQRWTAWLHEAVRKAAAHRLMVDVHDEYRPTGYSRTYPNLMTQEGLAGDETSPANANTLTILFSRMLAGAADHTICYYDARVARNATHAYQLAKAVCLYSPWQFVFWYDRPPQSPQGIAGAGGAAPVIGDEPELEFFASLPTVWDDTKVIHGRIGEFAVIARRSGEEWYVAGMNTGEARTLDVPLDFLARHLRYTAHRYRDDPSAATRTRVTIERTSVSAGGVLQLSMPARGGQAVRIAPAR